RELNQETNRIASALKNMGLQPGDRMALCAPGSYRWMTLYFGALKAGAVAVTLSDGLRKGELVQILDDAKPKILFAAEEKLHALSHKQDYPYLRKIICPGGDISYEDLIEKGSPSFAAIDRNRKNTAAILYTGGTTGIPKGVMLTQENLMTSIHNIAHFEGSTHRDCALCFLPLNHVFGQVHIMNATIYSGGCLVLQPSFDLEKAIHAIAKNRVTKLYAVPTIYIRLLALDRVKQNLNSLRYCFSAAASMAAEVVREWKDRMDLDIHEAYGMTESAAMVT
ncbi:MAG: long-chain fatty acid--CoA ligase, partial [Deltaproteobacteria bacterium]|nr:long-chain fatty acid--CoA ligase [Deltaproteobacteria bacterium]